MKYTSTKPSTRKHEKGHSKQSSKSLNIHCLGVVNFHIISMQKARIITLVAHSTSQRWNHNIGNLVLVEPLKMRLSKAKPSNP